MLSDLVVGCFRIYRSNAAGILKNLADALKIDTFQLLLPIKNTLPAGISSDEAVKRLLKIKRAYDDSFNEIVNTIK